MRKVVSVFLLLLFTSFLMAQQNGRIAGRVTYGETGEPIANVNVMIEEIGQGTTTKEDGTYIIRDIPAGEYQLKFSLMGMESRSETIIVSSDETTILNVQMERKALKMEDVNVNANRAINRETPVAFSNVDQEEISNKYTTGDMPQMLDDIPGLFSTTSGLGEAEITMRGFDAQKIQILINGIPVNDPESQVVYWSNWTGLSSNVKSVQVQRGAGASLYGSGAFGGSVNIETMGAKNDEEFTFRSSGGYYTTDGKSATSNGEMAEYDPINYNLMLKYSSGKIFNDKFKFNITAERKAGDYYIRGTEYDGWSFGFETESKLGNHVLNTSLIYAPQKHNQARSTYDRELGKFLGREFNFTNHKWQENKYVKPQFSVRDRWALNPQTSLLTNFFVTSGDGGGSYANNIIFDAESGALLYKPLTTEISERRNFAKYAFLVWKETGGTDGGYEIDGFEGDESEEYGTFNWAGDDMIITVASNTLGEDRSHSSKMTSYNKHKQVGLNSYLDRELTENIDLIVGAEGRYWQADHYKEGTDFRYYDPSDPDSISTLDAFMRDYDYTTDVLNTSAFARTKIKIPFDSGIQNVNLMLDGQYAVYHSKVEENMIHFYDFNNKEFIDAGYYASKQDSISVWQYDANGDSSLVYVPKFSEDDYERTFDFFSPKIGINVNLDEHWNILANYSIVYKEPKVRDWYDRDDGPGINQVVDNREFDLEPEKGETIEGGFGFKTEHLQADANYYYTKYTDKIESITDLHGDSKTINAGKATHQGLELSFKGNYGNVDANASATFSRNRWGDLNFQNIFYENAEDVEGKVVPFSPEKMAAGGIGYTFQDMPLYGSLRIGLNAKWTDDYYTTYDNVYCKQLYFYDEDGNFQSIGEHEFVENPDGMGRYDYNQDTGEYEINYQDQGDYDREWILTSSKLPAFLELNSTLSYKFFVGNNEASIKLNFNNILNKDDNYSKAYIGRAYGMQLKRIDDDGDVYWDDPTFGEGASNGNSEGAGYYPYLSPSPLFNIFLTLEYKF